MAPWHGRAGFARALADISRVVSILIAAIALVPPGTARGGDVPTFAVDAAWPKPLPNNPWARKASARPLAGPPLAKADSGMRIEQTIELPTR